MSLYLDYRPQQLDEVVGNKEIVSSLKTFVDNPESCPHSFMFTGPTGCGKTTIARILAKELGVEDIDYKELDSADFRGIDTIRDLRKQSQYTPIKGDIKVWVLDEAHKLTNDAQNALLKLLEDTPEHIYIIICTTDPQKIISAVKGRCVSYQVELLNEKQMKRLLHKIVKEEGLTLEKSVYDTIIDSAKGHPRNALQILEQVLSVPPNEQLKQAEKYEAEQINSIELCRALLKNSGWKEVRSILGQLKSQDPETIRRHVLGYTQSVLLKADNPKAGLILEMFIEPFYNSGFPGLVLACYSVVKE